VVLKENPENLKKYLAGKEKILSLFVGEVMKKTQGKANPKLVNEILKIKLTEDKDRE
jgi:Asp-tRNA(Asn)/Glu-tRNA(Gln) amidotransferase B subunit